MKTTINKEFAALQNRDKRKEKEPGDEERKIGQRGHTHKREKRRIMTTKISGTPV